MAAKKRIVGLDALRGVAVLLVIFSHFNLILSRDELARIGFIDNLRLGGWSGVDLFFVLSGFLVSGLLFAEQHKTGGVRRGRFLIRRGFKIYPAFYVLALASWATFTLADRPIPPREVLAELLFVQNYFPGIWPHTWTLAVEEHFYFGLALSFPWMMRRPERIPLGVAVVAVVLLVVRIAHAQAVGTWELRAHHYPTRDSC